MSTSPNGAKLKMKFRSNYLNMRIDMFWIDLVQIIMLRPVGAFHIFFFLLPQGVAPGLAHLPPLQQFQADLGVICFDRARIKIASAPMEHSEKELRPGNIRRISQNQRCAKAPQGQNAIAKGNALEIG